MFYLWMGQTKILFVTALNLNFFKVSNLTKVVAQQKPSVLTTEIFYQQSYAGKAFSIIILSCAEKVYILLWKNLCFFF